MYFPFLFPLSVSWQTFRVPDVGSTTSKSGMVKNVRVAVGIDLPSFSAEKLFARPVSGQTI